MSLPQVAGQLISRPVRQFKIVNAESYFRDRLKELQELADRGDPWVFLCASSYIEYLAKIVNCRPTTSKDYKDFLRNYFFTACPEYAKFRYASGKTDLADQMYHVLRCGIVHSFSLFADPTAKAKYGGRDRSILLAHRKNGAQHLDSYVNNHTQPKVDAAVFTAEDFVADICKLTDFVFAEARKRTVHGQQLKSNIRAWVTTYPPIMGIFQLKGSNVRPNPSNFLTIKRITSA